MITNALIDPLRKIMGLLYQAHPWHGIDIGDEAPDTVHAYIEIVPADTVKYELDKDSGILKVDRPQKYSNVTPSLYGLIPQTFCGESVAEFCRQRSGRAEIVGDGDPLDICVLAEKEFSRGDFIIHAIPIGGLRMLDNHEADDKIIAVMRDDAVYGDWRDINDCPPGLLDRLRHYFLTYKLPPDASEGTCEITHIYNRAEAHEVIRRSIADYNVYVGELAGSIKEALIK